MHDEKSSIQLNLEDLLDTGINHIMLINERGRVDSIVSKSEISLSKEKQEIFFMGSRLHRSLLQEFDEEFGSVEHFVICRKNIKIVSIPFGSRNLVFMMDNEFDHESIVRKIRLIKSHNSSIQELKLLCAETIYRD